jgi:hypothetical protein
LKSRQTGGKVQRNGGGSALKRPLAAIVLFTFALGLETTYLLALTEEQTSAARVPMNEVAGKAHTVSAQTSALQVQVYDYAGLSPAALHQFIARTQEILASSGVSVEVDACEGDAAPCESRTGSSRQIVMRVVAGPVRKMKNAAADSLGLSIAYPDGGTYASVFVQPTKNAAAEADLPWVIVLAYAAAHEIGHLVLGNRAHTANGLMKANWDTNDFWAMAQNRFHFSPVQRRELASRYGTAHSAELGAGAELDSCHR